MHVYRLWIYHVHLAHMLIDLFFPLHRADETHEPGRNGYTWLCLRFQFKLYRSVIALSFLRYIPLNLYGYQLI